MKTLGKEITIPSDTKILENLPGFRTMFNVPSVSIIIGIGKDHSAELIMGIDDYNALNNGEEIII